MVNVLGGVGGERNPAETDQATGSARNKQILGPPSQPCVRVSMDTGMESAVTDVRS